MTRVTDPALLQQLNAPDSPTPGVRFAPQGKPSPNGLVWDKDGGRDPQTGEVVMAGKPMSENAPSQGLAAASSALSGVPIAGPYLERGALKAGAYLRDKFYGDPADQTESAVQGDIERSQAAYPKTSTAAGIAGGVVGMAPAVAAAPEMFGAGAGGLTGGKVIAGGLSGGAVGATDAAVRSDAELRAIKAGALSGGIGGTAGPVVGAALSRGIHAGADALAQLGSRRGTDLSRPAADIISRAIETDGAQGAANIRAAGPGGMLADAGPATAGVLDTALQRAGPGATAARDAIEQRASVADRDLTVTLDRTLGAPRGIQTATNDIRNGTASARQTAYDAAYAQPIDYASPQGRSIETIVRNHVPAKAIEQANALIRADPKAGPSRQILAHVADDGSVTYERMPDVRQLDYITRGLKDVADAQDGQGKLGGTTQLGRVYGNLAQALRGQLRQAVPQYARALETAAEPIAAREALQFGSEILRPNVPRDVAAETVSRMTGPELTQAQAGLRSQIAETLANVKRTITDPNIDARQVASFVKQMSSDASREKFALLVGEPEANAMVQALDRAAGTMELRARLAGNSRTYGRTATDQAIKQATGPGIFDRLLEGRPLEMGKAFASAVTGRRPQDFARREDAIYGELANVLTGPRGPAAEGILERLIRTNDRRTAAGSIAGSVPYGALAQTGLLSLLPALNQRAQ